MLFVKRPTTTSGASRRRRFVVLSAVTIVVAFGASTWRLGAQKQPTSPASAVRTLAPSERIAARPGEKGATYYWLEEQTTRLSVTFADATAITERVGAGDIRSRLTDPSGNELASLNVDRVDATNDVLHYRSPAGGELHALNQPGTRATLDSSGRQVYSLWKDRIRTGDRALEWQDGLMRPAGAARRNVEREIRQIQTDWTSGLTAKVVRKPVPPGIAYKGRPVHGQVATTRLSLDGVNIGLSSWFEEIQVLAWDLPGISQGYLGPEHLREYGGWPFTPDMTWMNLQTIAFHHFKTLIDKHGFVARDQQSRPNPILQFFVPSVQANEPGCDGFHWLDGTVLRYCCDRHDFCYSRNGCTSSTWWEFWSSWTCTACNQSVVSCFGSGGLDAVLHPIP